MSLSLIFIAWRSQALICLILLYQSIHSQSRTTAPTNIVLTGFGARMMRVDWSHQGGIVLSGFRIVLDTLSERSNSQITVNVTNISKRQQVISGLEPYRYSNSSGVLFEVRVAAVSSGTGELVFADDVRNITLPLCPGLCDYRNMVETSSSCTRCECNPAYQDAACSTPTYAPGDVAVTFDRRVGQDVPQLTVKWDTPAPITLDGRLLRFYIIRVYALGNLGNTEILIFSFSPNPDPEGRNIRVVGDPSLSPDSAYSYSSFHYGVTVEVMTDVSGDTAVSDRVDVTTHIPGSVVNLNAIATDDTIHLTWSAPSDPPQFLTGYNVTVGEDDAIFLPDSFLNISQLTPATTYTIYVSSANSFGGGSPIQIIVTTQLPNCAANTYGPSSSSCTLCPNHSLSVAGSVNFSDCQCEPGYYQTASPSLCIPCAMRFYKSITGNTLCNACMDELSTTSSTGSISSSDCNRCRYNEGSFPEGPCYFFTDTLPITVVNGIQAFVNFPIVQVHWSQIPQFVSNTDGSYQVQNIGISCVGTGRGLIAGGFQFNQTAILPADGLNSPFLRHGLMRLIEYSCQAYLEAVLADSQLQAGPPSQTVTFVTWTVDTDTSLPQISNIQVTSNTEINVSYSLHANLAPLITSFVVSYTYADDTTNTQTASIPLPPQSQGSAVITGLTPGVRLIVRLLTDVGNVSQGESGRSYASLSLNVTLIDQVTTEELTTPPLTTPSLLMSPEIVMDQSVPVNGTTAIVVWQSVTGAFGYNIYVYRNGQLVGDVKNVIGSSVTQLVIVNLLPFTEYSIQAEAVQSNGMGGQLSLPILIKTPEAMSSPPEEIMVAEIAGGLINITWTVPNTPNGIITGYTISVTSGGETKTITVDNTTFSSLLSLPLSPYSVMVQALNGAGLGAPASPPVTSTDTTFSSDTSATVSIIVIIAPAVAGGVTIFLCILLVVLCGYCFRRKHRSRKQSFIKNNNYVEGGFRKRPPANLPTRIGSQPLPPDHLTFVNPIYPEDPSYLNPSLSPKGKAMEAAAEEYTDMNTGCVAGEEQYAEVSTAMRRQVTAITLIPESIAVKVKKEATPEDYDNEELYTEMQKIYFSDTEQANSLAVYEFDRSSLDLAEQIGQGEFGRVMRATAKNIIPGEATSTVAVKMLKDDADEKKRKSFLGEAQLLAKFGSHPNVMGLLKVVCRSTPMMVVIWYMPHGDLRHYLKKCANDKNSKIGTSEKLSISQQIAAGMEYLAGKYFIHRDLAARNVLVGYNNQVKISDFGLSRALAKDDSYYQLSQVSKLPAKWMALESLLYQKFSTYSDVWSFGVVLWEIFSFGKSPYKSITAMHITQHLQDGNRLPCPADCSQEIYQVMLDCWKVDKTKRPPFTQLKLKFKSLAISNNRAAEEVVENEEMYQNYI